MAKGGFRGMPGGMNQAAMKKARRSADTTSGFFQAQE